MTYIYRDKEYPSIYALSKSVNISRNALYYRINKLHLSIDEAINYVPNKPQILNPPTKHQQNQNNDISKSSLFSLNPLNDDIKRYDLTNQRTVERVQDWISTAPIFLIKQEIIQAMRLLEASKNENRRDNIQTYINMLSNSHNLDPDELFANYKAFINKTSIIDYMPPYISELDDSINSPAFKI